MSPGSTDTAILVESARLYGLESAQSFADQQVRRAAARPGRGRRHAGVAGRSGEQRHDRCQCRRRRRPDPLTPLPPGWRLVIDPSVRTLDDGNVLVGGYPGRLLRLSGSGRTALAGLIAGSRGSVAARRLGRRLVDAGMAHPRPPGAHDIGDVTVVIPAQDRPDLLERCLDAVGSDVPVVVVDDGSARPGPIAEVCRRHRARLVVREHCGGPAVARNDALPEVRTDLIAFLDSDCVPHPNWLAELVGLFGDPEIGAVAPRVLPITVSRTGRPTFLDRYGSARSPLDLGPRRG